MNEGGAEEEGVDGVWVEPLDALDTKVGHRKGTAESTGAPPVPAVERAPVGVGSEMFYVYDHVCMW